MKMVWRALQGLARCHEHGMDRVTRFEEFAAASRVKLPLFQLIER
jgi:hypothetical protein